MNIIDQFNDYYKFKVIIKLTFNKPIGIIFGRLAEYWSMQVPYKNRRRCVLSV